LQLDVVEGLGRDLKVAFHVRKKTQQIKLPQKRPPFPPTIAQVEQYALQQQPAETAQQTFAFVKIQHPSSKNQIRENV
jgi:hypothetical protein